MLPRAAIEGGEDSLCEVLAVPSGSCDLPHQQLCRGTANRKYSTKQILSAAVAAKVST
jgi:hypothetical protein